MTIEQGKDREKLFGHLPEKFRPIMEEAVAASGRNVGELIKTGFATRMDRIGGGTRVTFPGILDLTKHPEITIEDLPGFLVVEGDLVVDGNDFFNELINKLDKKVVDVIGNIRIKNFHQPSTLVPSSGTTLEEYLANEYTLRGSSLGGIILER